MNRFSYVGPDTKRVTFRVGCAPVPYFSSRSLAPASCGSILDVYPKRKATRTMEKNTFQVGDLIKLRDPHSPRGAQIGFVKGMRPDGKVAVRFRSGGQTIMHVLPGEIERLPDEPEYMLGNRIRGTR
jgi:hypothetical protein